MPPSRKNTKRDPATALLVRNILVFGFAVFAIYAIQNRVSYLLTHSELFEIKEIILDPAPRLSQSKYIARLKGRNIFSIDLKLLQSKLATEFPEINDLRVFRKFPDKIFILAKKRDPFAELVMGERHIVLDQEGIVLAMRPLAKGSQLPFISGLKQHSEIVIGEPVRQPKIDIALAIIRSMRAEEALETYKIRRIDVENLSRIHFELSNDVKIIVDQDNIEEKTKKLSLLLSQGQLPLKDITYIDLRFREPILGKSKI